MRSQPVKSVEAFLWTGLLAGLVAVMLTSGSRTSAMPDPTPMLTLPLVTPTPTPPNPTPARVAAGPTPMATGDLGWRSLSGWVRGAIGVTPVPLAGAVVHYSHYSLVRPGSSGSTTTNADGRFSFGPIFLHDTDGVVVSAEAVGFLPEDIRRRGYETWRDNFFDFVLLPIPEPPSHVSLTGPATGLVSTDIFFTAVVSPVVAALPITFTWQTAPWLTLTHTGGLSDTATLSWPSEAVGVQTITVTALNIMGAVSGFHTIELLSDPYPYRVFLPLFLKP